jgi:hypothetical protein
MNPGTLVDNIPKKGAVVAASQNPFLVELQIFLCWLNQPEDLEKMKK